MCVCVCCWPAEKLVVALSTFWWVNNLNYHFSYGPISVLCQVLRRSCCDVTIVVVDLVVLILALQFVGWKSASRLCDLLCWLSPTFVLIFSAVSLPLYCDLFLYLTNFIVVLSSYCVVRTLVCQKILVCYWFLAQIFCGI